MHPPSLFAEALSRAASEEYYLNDRQGGIVNRVQGVHRYFVSKFAAKGNCW